MRITIRIPDDLHEKLAIDALKKPQNSKEAVIAEILRAHYAGRKPAEAAREALGWTISDSTRRRIAALRRWTKAWK